MKRKTYNASVPAVSGAYLAAGAIVGGLLDLIAVPALWQAAAAVWNPLSEILGAPTRDGLPMLPCPDTTGLGTIETARALLAGTNGMYAGVCAATLSACVLYALFASLTRYERQHDGSWAGPAPAAGEATHGSARIVSAPSAVRRLTRGWRAGHVPEGGTVVVGGVGSGGRELRLLESTHTCVLGRSGDGKSRRVVAATIMANVLMGRTVVVNDVKGELGDWIAPWARSLGSHRVACLRLDDPAASDVRWDPMARARKLVAAGRPGEAEAELRELARCMIGSEKGEGSFFADAGRSVMCGLMLHVLTSPDVPDDCRNLSTALALVTADGRRSQMQRLEELQRSVPVGSRVANLLGIVSGERGGGPGAVTNVTKALSHFADGEIDVLLHDDELDLATIGERPTLLFISSQSATGDRSSLVNALFSQVLSSLRACARRHGGRVPTEAVLVMDEFASIGRCERLLRDIGEMRSEGISLIACWQSLHQLQATSGYSREEAQSLLDQLHTKVVLSCGDAEIAETLSRTIGCQTVIAPGQSQTRSNTGGSTGTSDSRVSRRVVTCDELMRWGAAHDGTLVIGQRETIALRSLDIAETFLAPMLGMGDDGSGRELRERALVERLERNTEHPRVWAGPTEDVAAEALASDDPFTPEGF